MLAATTRHGVEATDGGTMVVIEGPRFSTRAESPTADLTWDIRDGDHRLVIMNADGSAFVDADAELALALDHAFPVGLAVLAGGGLMALVGVVLVVRALTAAR